MVTMIGRSRLAPMLAVSIGLGLSLLAAELLFRGFPRLLPPWYRQTLPVGGIELIEPGVLARTPVEGVPLPYGWNSGRRISGPVPRDLQHMGLVAPADNPDPKRYPEISYRCDGNGFLNPRDLQRADAVLVGDSFTVAAGVLEPAGLQSLLTEATGLKLWNLAVPGIGPLREEWLLNQVGLALRPQAVIWFFFGGNDLADATRVERYRRGGLRTHADLVPGAHLPRLLTMEVLCEGVKRVARRKSSVTGVPGLVFETPSGSERIWFLPGHLRRLRTDRETVASSLGWAVTSDVFRRVSHQLERRSVELLVVFVPSKAQVYLPFVKRDPELVHRMASHDLQISQEPVPFLEHALRNRGAVETLLGDFCRENGISFLSLTPRLEALAASGGLGYLTADTHWNATGQATALEPLQTFLARIR
jgi:hypothetical protein